MIGGEIEMNEFLESLTDEELENLMEEIQERLRRRRGKCDVYGKIPEEDYKKLHDRLSR